MASLQEQSADLFGKNPELKYKTVEEIKECTRLSGCRVRDDGTIEY